MAVVSEGHAAQAPERSLPYAAPERSLAQRMDALALANEVRMRRAGLKREMKAGRVVVQDVVREPGERLASMKVLELLLAAPKIGRVKANRALAAVGIAPSKTLGGLSERQRAELLVTLGGGRVRRPW